MLQRLGVAVLQAVLGLRALGDELHRPVQSEDAGDAEVLVAQHRAADEPVLGARASLQVQDRQAVVDDLDEEVPPVVVADHLAGVRGHLDRVGERPLLLRPEAQPDRMDLPAGLRDDALELLEHVLALAKDHVEGVVEVVDPYVGDDLDRGVAADTARGADAEDLVVRRRHGVAEADAVHRPLLHPQLLGHVPGRPAGVDGTVREDDDPGDRHAAQLRVHLAERGVEVRALAGASKLRCAPDGLHAGAEAVRLDGADRREPPPEAVPVRRPEHLPGQGQTRDAPRALAAGGPHLDVLDSHAARIVDQHGQERVPLLVARDPQHRMKQDDDDEAEYQAAQRG